MMRILLVVFMTTRLVADTDLGALSGPVLGHTERNGVLMPLLGVPGAAYFGRAVHLDGLEVVAFSSQGGYAIATTADRTNLRIIGLPGGAKSGGALTVNAPVQSVHLSPAGRAALLVFDDGIDVIGGLPQQPVVKSRIAKSAELTRLAVSDDGEAVAMVEGSGAAWIIENSDKRRIPAAHLRDIEFRPGSHDYVFIDGDVVALASKVGSTTIAGPAEGLAAPSIARSSPNSAYTAVLDRNTRLLFIRGDQAASSETLELPCEAAGLEWLQHATLRASCQRTGTVYLVQITNSGLRLLFVPEPVE
jgi:hypothetical protein